MGNNDTVSSLVCLLIGLGFVAGGVAMGLGPLNAPGAGFFPAVIGGIFSLLSGALFLKAFPKESPTREKKSFWREEKSWVRVSLSLCALLFYLFSLNYLGYILTTILFLLFLLKFVGKKGMGGLHFHGDCRLSGQLCPVSDGAGGIPAQRLDHNLMVS